MRNDSLRDLCLAGVRWELSDAAKPFQKESEELRVESSDSKEKIAEPEKNLKSEILNLKSSVIPPVAAISQAAAMARAAELAAAAADWGALCNAIEAFAEHPLRTFAKSTVLPHIPATSTNRQSPIAVITDLPSSDDEESGAILSGAAGALFDKMMSAIGYSRADIAIIPMVFWRPPGGRTPTDEELATARPLVLRAVEFAAPRAILTLGALSAAEIAGAKLPKQHGEVIQSLVVGRWSLVVGKRNTNDQRLTTNDQRLTTIIPIYHPNYLLLKPDAKRPVWDALQKLLQIVQN